MSGHGLLNALVEMILYRPRLRAHTLVTSEPAFWWARPFVH